MDQVGNFGAAGGVHGKVIRPVSAPLNEILTTYRTLKSLRSAISSTHPKLDDHLAGQHTYVIQLLKPSIRTHRMLILSLTTFYHLDRSLKLKDLSLKLCL